MDFFIYLIFVGNRITVSVVKQTMSLVIIKRTLDIASHKCTEADVF